MWVSCYVSIILGRKILHAVLELQHNKFCELPLEYQNSQGQWLFHDA
jgi:hypothetical protein